jgi:hypothetical protein
LVSSIIPKYAPEIKEIILHTRLSPVPTEICLSCLLLGYFFVHFAVVSSSLYGEHVEPFGHLFYLFYPREAVPHFLSLHFDF